MKINRVDALFSTNYPYKKTDKPLMPFWGLKLSSPLKQDSISFKSKPDLLTLPKEQIFEIIKKSLKTENRLGEGTEGIVYKIADTDYCFKRPFFAKDYTTNFDLNINAKDKVNHIVAKLGSECIIMKFLEGYPINGTDSRDQEQLEYIAETIEDFPEESFYKFFEQIVNAHKNNMQFDNHSGNVIINPKDQTFAILDCVDKNQLSYFERGENLDPLYLMFTSIVTLGTNFNQTKVYLKKIFSSTLKDFEPNVSPKINPEEYDFTPFIQWLSDSKYINISKENLESYKTEFNELIELKNKEIEGNLEKKTLQNKLDKIREIIAKTF